MTLYRVSGPDRPTPRLRASPRARPRCRAVTLIEAVLFISVALGLIVGGIVFYRQASEAARVEKQIRVLTAIVAELRAAVKTSGLDGFNAGSGYVSGGIDEYLAASGALPADVIRPPGDNSVTLATSWESSLMIGFSTFAPGPQQGSPNPVFTVFLQRLPTAACASLSIIDAAGAGAFSDGIIGVGAHNANRPNLAPLMLPPISPADAANACSAADTDNDGTVSLQFEVAAFG